ncbi:hypothetical protein ACT3CD_15255 [Geofilum sp. OHC36d9]|uniref:hypothetical protein n=1 Tax=Geofilum sp. OHC36d9 TaxID=3458413 RepID=UPI00403440EB
MGIVGMYCVIVITITITAHQPFIQNPKCISSFIAGFKSAINSKIDDYIDEKQLNIPKYHRNNHFWQPNYFDHIIRNDQELERIRHYIVRNPQNWQADKFHSEMPIGLGNDCFVSQRNAVVGLYSATYNKLSV